MHLAQAALFTRIASWLFSCTLVSALLISPQSKSQEVNDSNDLLRFRNSNRPVLIHSFEMPPLPQINDPEFRSFMLSALLRTVAVHDSLYDITSAVINGLGFFCNRKPTKRVYFDSIQYSEFRPGAYPRVLAEMKDTCNIRVFVRHTAECQSYVVVYNYPTQAPPFLSDGARFEASEPGAHLSIVQTSVSGTSSAFFAKAADLADTALAGVRGAC